MSSQRLGVREPLLQTQELGRPGGVRDESSERQLPTGLRGRWAGFRGGKRGPAEEEEWRLRRVELERRREATMPGLMKNILVAGTMLSFAVFAAVGPEPVPAATSPRPATEGLEEDQTSDPDMPVERLTLTRDLEERISAAVDAISRGPKKDPEQIALRMLKIARSYTVPPPTTNPVSRTSNPQQVTKFLKLLHLPLRFPDGKWVPYCACGVSYAAAAAYCQEKPVIRVNPSNDLVKYRGVLADIRNYYFFPDPRCRVMLAQAQKRGTWKPAGKVSPGKAKPGWLVLFNWKRGSAPQHVGIVDQALGGSLKTVEFNTSAGNNSNGGAVNARNRSYQHVLGYIATY
jgi:hypothetical protein